MFLKELLRFAVQISSKWWQYINHMTTYSYINDTQVLLDFKVLKKVFQAAQAVPWKYVRSQQSFKDRVRGLQRAPSITRVFPCCQMCIAELFRIHLNKELATINQYQ